MAKVPINDPIKYELNDKTTKEYPRNYLGLSQIGGKCHREQQYYHYWAYTITTNRRIKRLFGFGHLMENVISADLKSIGYTIESSQQEIIGTGGHWKGHIDFKAILDGFTYLLEVKTHNDKSFQSVKKDGVKKSKPGHYGQVQSYMGYLELTKCIYVAYNKNDSEYYIEIIDFDPEYFAELKRKEAEIIMSDVLLPRIGNNNPSWFECKMCNARHVCFNKVPINKSCRSCKNVIVSDRGQWLCGLENEYTLTNEQQKEACDKYELEDMFK